MWLIERKSQFRNYKNFQGSQKLLKNKNMVSKTKENNDGKKTLKFSEFFQLLGNCMKENAEVNNNDEL